MKHPHKLFTLAVLSLALTGCGWFGGGEKDASTPADTAGTDAAGGESMSTTPMSDDPAPVEIGGGASASDAGSGAPGGDATGGERGTPSISTGLVAAESVIYFDYDSSDINSSGLKLVQEFAKFLTDNPATKVRLEGHADERGTREYNIGLGERRANAVQQALLNNGATDAQLAVISYGEERPLDAAHSDAAWSRNRRVELIKP